MSSFTSSFLKTALHYAISNTELSCLDLLLASHAINPDVADQRGCTPLWHVAASDGREPIMHRLLAAGANVNKKDKVEKRSPLLVSVQ